MRMKRLDEGWRITSVRCDLSWLNGNPTVALGPFTSTETAAPTPKKEVDEIGIRAENLPHRNGIST